MTIKRSTPLVNALCATAHFGSVMNNFVVHYFDGPVPATADEAIDVSNTKLATFTLDDLGAAGATWNTGGVANGVIIKAAADDLAATGLAAGTPSFFRVCVFGDDGEGAVTTEPRYQGTIGPNSSYDLVREGNPAIGVSDPLTLPTVQYQMPTT